MINSSSRQRPLAFLEEQFGEDISHPFAQRCVGGQHEVGAALRADERQVRALRPVR
ncbi:hypothetical protein FHU35_14548 [Saccharopolyspora dendranthemae]|uniref:Uncharacterized protein n=1 Tax=Saccharopolyspora dendranthemae TaxID=1181886 RepID=A0A561U4H8_9PSEU|nr:hypothetical protein FHU35_14548 [Saccharopolyspora dendranthemae]